MNSVVAVVVTYNRKDMLTECLQALKAQSKPCDVIVVDNCSTDGTREMMAELVKTDKRLTLFCMEKNEGGAGGFYAGMKLAAERGYGYVWLMDDDTFAKPDALEQLLMADEQLQGNYGWLSSVVLWKDGRECKMNRQKLKKSYYDYAEYLKYGIVQAEQATFVSLFVPMKTIKKVGLPIRQFFIWGDDIEYTRRITVRNELPGFIAGQSQVIHAMKQNGGSCIATDHVERITRYNYAFRNENYLYRKEGLKGFLYYTAKCGLNFCRIWVKAKDHRCTRSWIILKNYVMGLFFNPKIERINQA